MRQYHIDELQPEDIARFVKSLEDNGMTGIMEGLYWLEMPKEMLNEEQVDHFDECGPYVMGIEIGEDWVRLELLVRAKNRMRCSCVTYANTKQRDYGMDALDGMLKELDIPV